jgi:hypothetical protein
MPRIRQPGTRPALEKAIRPERSQERSGQCKNTALPSGNGDLVPPNAKGQFVEGAVGNPLGRNAGSKNAISHAFLKDLQALWEDQGPAILKRVAKRNPEALIRVMATLVPKEMAVDETQRVYIIRDEPMSAEEWHKEFADGEPFPATS